MATSSPSAPIFSASFCCTRTGSSSRFLRFPPIRVQTQPFTCRLTLTSYLNASSSSTASNGYEFDDHDVAYELQHGVPTSPPKRQGSSVYVTLPLDAIDLSSGELRRKKTMFRSFLALAAAGVEGVVMEVWWGLVEKESPGHYNWQGYFEILTLAKSCGLKIRAVLAFHQCGWGPDNTFRIPLPQWVLKEMDQRSRGIQVGMGPAGELRYPSFHPQKFTWVLGVHELGEFQCYDKYMLASLNACARDNMEMSQWGNGGPFGAGSTTRDPERTVFQK